MISNRVTNLIARLEMEKETWGHHNAEGKLQWNTERDDDDVGIGLHTRPDPNYCTRHQHQLLHFLLQIADMDKMQWQLLRWPFHLAQLFRTSDTVPSLLLHTIHSSSACTPKTTSYCYYVHHYISLISMHAFFIFFLLIIKTNVQVEEIIPNSQVTVYVVKNFMEDCEKAAWQLREHDFVPKKIKKKLKT